MAGRSEARSTEDSFEFACAYNRVYFRNVLLDLVTVALNQASGDDQALGFATVGLLMLHHLKDSVDRLLLGGVDEAAGIDDKDLCIFGLGSDLAPSMVKHSHHDFGVDQVFGAAEGDETDLRPGQDRGRGRG